MNLARKKLVLFGAADSRDQIAVADVLRQETVGGALMLVATVVALGWANLGTSSYDHVRHLQLGPLSLQHWAADGILTIFFFVAGLELKRELTVGSLSRPAEALVPIAAAACGMVVPAALYLAVNVPIPGGQPQGWAIPMATDIAFALAILAVVGSRLPASLRAFLLTLAIVDDLGAIVIIATVFTSGIQLLWLAAAAGCAGLWWLLQRRQVPGWYLYLPLAVMTWACTLQSGVHPTIAGVALGLLTRSGTATHDPLIDRWEHLWRPVSAGFAVPVFALLSAGVVLSPAVLSQLVREPLAVGVMVGLLAGKSLGIFGGAYLTARFTRAELAPDLRWREVFAVAVLAGVGFTVALLISDLAFAGDTEKADQAKAAVLIASLVAAVVGAVLLRRRGNQRRGGGTAARQSHDDDLPAEEGS
ncbi:Na+/H+ antiporter NhaA [Microlunatus panaciterrae]|uniref:Na(+)/H(+) antiporter NhaA n=1 Tax=Microlunatus panaciterrae TaxID=400768 RepID=A0ABS2RJM6_9ACTN|nr:Na+/H+ antiporter NhaA [Microlunatus panaciterrae]MBM7799211.1 NhaA family Na+:H+ antiporter [Microlunatus panaciterrae]